ncbi:SNF2 family N-terminal domain-containing protein, partial [Tribonema minus]
WKALLPRPGRDFKGNLLRDYQLEGVRWMLSCWYRRRSCILADEMGLGKTVQVTALLEHIFSVDGIRGPFLVVVPLSTIEHWRREIEAWTDMELCVYHDIGGGREMRDVIREYEWHYRDRAGNIISQNVLKFHVLLTTYDDMIRDVDELSAVAWRCVVVDEAHRLRNLNSRLLECLRAVMLRGAGVHGFQHRVLMTGTPLQNNMEELWSLMNFIEPDKFGDRARFLERYGAMETEEQVRSLQRRIAPHMLRRVKEDVASDIPPKEETVVDVELTLLQKQYYRAIFEKNHAILYKVSSGASGGAGIPSLMNIQMELRKCCNHPYLVRGVEDHEVGQMLQLLQQAKGPAGEAELARERLTKGLVQSSGKMVLLDKLLTKLRREGHKVLLFSQFIGMLDIIGEYASLSGIPHERLDGRITGNERQRAIDRFNRDPASFLFLLSTRAGGVGINLTAADVCIIFDSDWNPQNDVQAMARCHRIGQTKQVAIYRLITRGSFESEMFARASRKLGLEQAVLG